MTVLFKPMSPSVREMLLGFSISCACAATNVFLDPNRIIGIILLIVGFLAMNVFFANWLLPQPDGYVLRPLKRWWRDFSTPATVGKFKGLPVLERWELLDFRSICDGDGRLIATEQKIDWSATDMDWVPGDPKDIQVIVKLLDGKERLPWLARLRSPKLLPGNMAEVMGRDGDIAQTTYTVD